MIGLSKLRSIATWGTCLAISAILFALNTVAFAQPGTYYNSISSSNSTFVTDLHNLINPHTRITYDQFDETNVANFASRDTSGGNKVVTCVYSGENYVYIPPFAWGHFSREHTWCQSWMPSGAPTNSPEYSDQHHLFPTEQNHANGVRSNHPEGNVVSPTSTYLQCKLGTDASGHTVFEPRASHKGDAARALMYMSVCYNTANGFDWTFNHLNTVILPSLSEAPQDVSLLLQWSKDDPPDAWEMARNNYIQSIQGNRNPFVDHPEWVNYIDFTTLSKLSPAYAAEPSNFVTDLSLGSVTSSSLTVNWTNAVAGIQSPSGYLIEIFHSNDYFIPADGSTYFDDTDISDGRGVKNIDNTGATSYTFTGLTCGTTYYIRVYSYNGSSSSINYKIDEPVPAASSSTGSASLGPEPTNHPGGFSTQAPTITNSSITVKWTDAAGGTSPSGYVIFANTTNTFTDPIDGVEYPNDTFLSDGSAVANVAYSAPDSFQFAGLVSATTYAFKIYPYIGDGCQRNYKTDNFPILTNNIEYTTTGPGSSSPSVVVNEYMNGSDQTSEWAELLVVDNNLDLRGMKLRDYSSTGSTQAGLTFSNDNLWSAVESGSFIVVLAATNGAAQDFSFVGDRKVVVSATNATYFTGTSFNISGTADAVEILTFGNTHIHSLSHGSKPGNIATLPSPTANASSSSSSGNVVRFINITTVSDFGLDAKTQHSYSVTQGASNDASETTFISTTLPVELSSFVAFSVGMNVHLEWATATETNNYGFEVERSVLHYQLWEKVGFIEGHGTSNTPEKYSFSENISVLRPVLYRLKQIDREGAIHYSNAIEVNAALTVEDFRLAQNFPNPFNPSTTIRFAVKSSRHVSLNVYNMLGQEVRSLFDQEAEANVAYAIPFEGSGLSSGVYYYKLRTADHIELKKMLLLK